MNKMENTMIQRMIREQRYFHIHGGYGWPGKDLTAPAVTKYPNILSELGWSMPWLYLPAEFADVSQEIMAAVVEDNEELSTRELWKIARYCGVRPGYLAAPGLSIIDPATKRARPAAVRWRICLNRPMGWTFGTGG